MTEETRDPKVSAHYRGLGADEPPQTVDEAILAAARRAVQSHPAPLVAPTGRRAWFVPLAAAAVLVLAVAVTLHMQLEQAGGDGVPTVEAPPKATESAPQERKTAQADRAYAPAQSPPKLEEPKAPPAPEPKPFAADSVAESAPRVARTRPEGAAEPMGGFASGPELSRSDREAMRDRQAAAERAAPAAPAAVASARPMPQSSLGEPVAKRAGEAADTPEKELERIVRLRSEGRHEEADKALAEFRKRFPDFKIPEPMLERVERR